MTITERILHEEGTCVCEPKQQLDWQIRYLESDQEVTVSHLKVKRRPSNITANRLNFDLRRGCLELLTEFGFVDATETPKVSRDKCFSQQEVLMLLMERSLGITVAAEPLTVSFIQA